MTSFANYLTPLATAVGGYQKGAAAKQADDTETFLKMIQLRRQQQQDQMTEAMNQAQRAEIDQRIKGQQQDVILKQQKAAANARARATLAAKDPTNPLLQMGDDGADFVSEVARVNSEGKTKAAYSTRQKAAHDALIAKFPKSAYAALPYDPANPMDFEKALGDEIAGARQQSLFGHQDTSREDTQAFQDAELTRRLNAKGAGGGVGGTANPDDMQNAMDAWDNAITQLHGKGLKVGQGMQQRAALDYGVASKAAKGESAFSDALKGGAMDMLGAGRSQPGYTAYEQAMQASRQFADEAARLFKQRGGFQQMKNEIALAQLTPADFENPMLIQQKRQRMQTLIAQARAMQPRTTPTTATTPTTGGNDADAEAAAIIAKHRGKTP